MSETMATPIPIRNDPPPAPAPAPPAPAGPRCDQCGKTFKAASGLGAHRRSAHGIAGTGRGSGRKAAAPARRTVATVPSAAPDGRDPWLVVVIYPVAMSASTAVLSTEADARQAAALLVALGHEPLAFRVADGRP